MRIAVAVAGAIALSGCRQERPQAQHPHDGLHGAPITEGALERDMVGRAFVDQSDDTVSVTEADCTGGRGGEAGATHLMCVLKFGSGLVADEVVVHVLPDEFMFESPVIQAAIDP